MVQFLKEFGQATSAFGFPTSEDNARAIDKYIEDNPDAQHFRKEVAGFESFILGERADVSVITDDSIDLSGEVVDHKSINFDEFRKNPLVAFGHNYTIPSIGKSIWQKQVANQWKAKTIYAPRPENHPKDLEWFPDTVYHLIKEGFLPGKSIGAVGKVRLPTEDDIKERPFLKSAKLIRYDIKVFEYSVVTKNCNKNALVEAIAKGTVNLSNETLDEHFSELAEIIKNARSSQKPKPDEEEKYVLKSFKTAKTKEQLIAEAVSDVQKKTPEIIDTALAKLFGKV
jgi:hypothetical protein